MLSVLSELFRLLSFKLSSMSLLPDLFLLGPSCGDTPVSKLLDFFLWFAWISSPLELNIFLFNVELPHGFLLAERADHLRHWILEYGTTAGAETLGVVRFVHRGLQRGSFKVERLRLRGCLAAIGRHRQASAADVERSLAVVIFRLDRLGRQLPSVRQ